MECYNNHFIFPNRYIVCGMSRAIACLKYCLRQRFSSQCTVYRAPWTHWRWHQLAAPHSECGRIISPKKSACIQSHGVSEAPASHVLPRSPHWKQLRSRWALPKRNFLLHRCTLSLLHTSSKMKSKPHLTRWLKNSELRIATHIFLSPLVTQHSSFWIQIICLFPLWLSNELFKMCVFCAQRDNRNKTNQEGKFGLRKCGWYLEAFQKE